MSLITRRNLLSSIAAFAIPREEKPKQEGNSEWYLRVRRIQAEGLLEAERSSEKLAWSDLEYHQERLDRGVKKLGVTLSTSVDSDEFAAIQNEPAPLPDISDLDSIEAIALQHKTRTNVIKIKTNRIKAQCDQLGIKSWW